MDLLLVDDDRGTLVDRQLMRSRLVVDPWAAPIALESKDIGL